MYYYLFSQTHFRELLKAAKAEERESDSYENHELLNFIKGELITFPIIGLPITDYKEYLKKYTDSVCKYKSVLLEETDSYGEPYYLYNGKLA